MITTEEYNEVPDSVLLMIAKKARNNMERDEITDLLDEVVRRYDLVLYLAEMNTQERTKEFIENTSMSDIIPPLEEDEGWISWGGGERPVPMETLVDVIYRDGTQVNEMVQNSHLSWKHFNNIDDVMYYRVNQT